MKIAHVRTGYIIIVWIVVVVMLGSVMYVSYRRNSSDLKLLMMNEAERLIEVASVSAAAGIHALDEVEDLIAQRLLDNARLLEVIATSKVPPHNLLSRITLNNDLQMINILDKQGNSISRSNVTEKSLGDSGIKHRSEVESVLSGKYDKNVIGFMEDQYYSGKSYGVVVRRNEGGAIVVNTGSDKMLDFRKKVGLGNLFREIGSRQWIRYIVLQDTLGIIAASSGVTEISRINGDPFLVRASEGDWGSRLISSNGERLLEVVRPLMVDNLNLGLLRIGLSTVQIDGIRQHALRQFIILFIAAVISGAFVLVYVILRQNYIILNAEHDRILQEVRIMEEETRRSERLTSMGRLAAGVAHEIRNPMNAISIIVQRLKVEFTPTENKGEYKSFLSTIGTEISRISSIIENFLKFARPPKLVITTVQVEQLVSDILNIIWEKAKSDKITIKTMIEPDISCRCDVDQIKQALLNIVLNALEAVREKGSVFISAEKRKGEVLIQVRDTGDGIPDDILLKIFDPYVTTKDRGMGLGLSEVHKIVTAHGGRVTAGNMKNGGAVLNVRLPV